MSWLWLDNLLSDHLDVVLEANLWRNRACYETLSNIKLNIFDVLVEPQRFNLGNSTDYSIRKVIEWAKKVTSRVIFLHMAARREDDPACLRQARIVQSKSHFRVEGKMCTT